MLIESLKELRDSGNSVIVVEHDKEMIMSADYVLDIGPRAGRHGGKVVAQGTPDDIMKACSLTSEYLNGTKYIPVPEQRRKGNGKTITLKEATGHNLKKVSIKIPLGKLICVTGVSGSGKSSIIKAFIHLFLRLESLILQSLQC